MWVMADLILVSASALPVGRIACSELRTPILSCIGLPQAPFGAMRNGAKVMLVETASPVPGPAPLGPVEEFHQLQVPSASVGVRLLAPNWVLFSNEFRWNCTPVA